MNLLNIKNENYDELFVKNISNEIKLLNEKTFFGVKK